MPEIVRRRTRRSDDGTHEHIELVGYWSPHTPTEPIMVDITRVLEKQIMGNSFWATIDGERVEVEAGKCFACGHEPYLVTEKDGANANLLFRLTEG